jgi:hypothetical protein
MTTRASRVIYTAITNGHAKLCARSDSPDTDFVCFSDVPLERSDWEIRPIEAPTGLTPRMQAKFHKLFPPKEYAWSVWMDGSHVLNTAESSIRMVDEMITASTSGFGLHMHPRLDCVYAEGQDVLSHALLRSKRRAQPIAEQLQHYRREGHPEHWGLWACGSICRNQSPLVQRAMKLWWNELLTWSERDQISLPFVMRTMVIRPDGWPWKLYENPYFSAIEHNWSV